MRKLFIILMILTCCAISAHAEVYSWTDEKGVKHFSTTPPDNKVDYQKNTEVPYDAKKDEAQTQAYQQWLQQKQQEADAQASEKQKQSAEQKKEEEKAQEEAEKIRLEAEKAQAEAEKARSEQQVWKNIYLRPGVNQNQK